ncbi:RelA/SpoT family protein [Ignatzschineria cameli]|uniref:GTP pyrophosphokinase n=1 Tax=Ignatzschineria cameli TaxID=2182793 RepID=A0A2U2AKM5_9GAMM|nr:bifunctional (p)ppGpp synthetase/guanosine-3',5'-bis(diphosphate) 3'-pyrophosphohydrolase [Ignatzschineria cameli]PWD83580.1 bifunctional (p)ppGpp synthetase/guanosine-3',5'-bis(diphosphate) 3'-pyrophosphohydrolase [Ignatzschineria cameli]PWD83745.1 bifunctional (p)ppGpp synthetase/guanosine-3',5'-bis(diphosphate) 3'-pyrophosphohydrolase [Ignatzschineria cameli]PWD88563.1 bifunctional (p)ppGpp synthetase/guanosine-3',5'-bis(diphosphate) 3'-pyrophosphohydrolase [Ignatzschineria cameli]PWD8999
MSKSITLTALLEWLQSKEATWKPEYYEACIKHQEHPLFKMALETAFYLEQLEIEAMPQVALILFVLGVPVEEQPEGTRKFIQYLGVVNFLTSGAISHEKSPETLRKMFLAFAEDVRVIVVMLAYQVIVMRNARDSQEEKQRLIAQNTNTIFAPIANRLGLAQIKWELEDYAFRFLEPDFYREIASKLDGKRQVREQYILDVIEMIERLLAEHQIEGEVTGRVKHIYSIARKMRQKNLAFEQLYDIRAVRILVDSTADCYAVLGMIHDLWTPIPREFDDYIANPKPNGYQSLHTVVLAPEDRTLEVQIRTHQMHNDAEKGVAAHWKYKEGRGTSIDQADLNWLRDHLDRVLEEGEEQITEESIFNENVFVMTPAGEPIELIAGSTPLDFAYKIHTGLGNRCRGAKVNGAIVPLTYVLQNRDVVEILTGKLPNPSRDWMSPHLGYTGSSRTRSKIRAWFRAQEIESNLQAGKQMVEKELARLNVRLSDEELRRLASRLHCTSLNDLYANIGAGDITIAQLLSRLPGEKPKNNFDPELMVRPQSKKAQSGIQVKGMGKLLTNIATCCKPAPPDLIGGYITINRGVTIHRINCVNYQNMLEQHPEREIDVDWGSTDERVVQADIHVTAYANVDLLQEISQLVSAEHLKITNMNMKSEADDTRSISFTLEINHVDQLSRLLDRINQIPAVLQAYRK